MMGNQIRAIVNRFEQEVAGGMDAHQAEESLMESLQKLGVGMMGQWDLNTQQTALEKSHEDAPKLHKHSKKLQWYTTFGTISIDQQVLR